MHSPFLSPWSTPSVICSSVNGFSGNSPNKSCHVGSQKPSHFFPGVRLHNLYAGNSFLSSAFCSGENVPRWTTTFWILRFLGALSFPIVVLLVLAIMRWVRRFASKWIDNFQLTSFGLYYFSPTMQPHLAQLGIIHYSCFCSSLFFTSIVSDVYTMKLSMFLDNDGCWILHWRQFIHQTGLWVNYGLTLVHRPVKMICMIKVWSFILWPLFMMLTYIAAEIEHPARIDDAGLNPVDNGSPPHQATTHQTNDGNVHISISIPASIAVISDLNILLSPCSACIVPAFQPNPWRQVPPPAPPDLRSRRDISKRLTRQTCNSGCASKSSDLHTY